MRIRCCQVLENPILNKGNRSGRQAPPCS
uniref:Uncharacterized protein n=1 Tax=Rhizophora mucronata TaxID=61149 RepID=A0A2P2MZS0_RHIMU